MRQEDFPIDKETVDRLIRQSEKYRTKDNKSNKYIYVNLSMVRLQTAWFFPKLIYALGVSKKLDANIIVITWRKNDQFERLLESMGMKHLCLESLNKRELLAAVKAFIYTLHIIFFMDTGEKLKEFRILDLPIGMALYEDILRTSDFSTIRSTRNAICIKKIFHIIWTVLSLDRFLKKNVPSYAIIDDIAYHESIFDSLFHCRGAKVVNVSPVGEEEVLFDEMNRTVRRGERAYADVHQRMKDSLDNNIAEVDKFFERKFSGLEGRNIDRGAFKGKEVLKRSEMIEKYHLDPQKKNIIIMAHTFSDAVFNYGLLYYRDYYDWLENTLKIAGTIKNVNWILKPHPTRAAYHESKDSIEMMYEKYKTENIWLLKDSVSAESVKNIADAVVTIGGNAGAEFACFGIPALIIGKPYYKGFGFTIEPRTKEQYEETLKKLDRVRTLDKDQVVMAKKVYYYGIIDKTSETCFKDEFAEYVNALYKKMQDEIALEYFESNAKTKDYNIDITEKISEYMEKHDMRGCEYYQRGIKRARLIES